MENFFNQIANNPNVRAARDAVANLPPPVKKAAKIGAIGLGTGVAVFATPPLLGFTASGVAAGSIAAGIQSAVFGAAVPAGSWFAIMQSIGATATIVPALIAGAGAAGVAGAAEAVQEDGPEDDEAAGEGGVEGEELPEENVGLLQVANLEEDQGVIEKLPNVGQGREVFQPSNNQH